MRFSNLLGNGFLFWLVLGAYSSVLAAAPAIPLDIRQTIEARVRQGFNRGIIFGVINPDGTNFFARGNTGLSHAPELTADSLFEIGSITKVFTSLLLAEAAQRNLLSLTNTASQFYTNAAIPSRNGKPITLTHLATHMSGLPRMPGNFAPVDTLDPYADYTEQKMLQFLAGYQLPRDPGASYEYSNFAFGFLGEILERAHGADYETLVKSRIASVLGMPDTLIIPSAAQRSRLARPHSGVVEGRNWNFDSMAAAGALLSSVNDLFKFLSLSMGLVTNSLSPAMAETLKIRSSIPAYGSMGLGWHILNAGTSSVVNHDGATGGYRAFIGFVRGGKTGVVVLSNSDTLVFDLGVHYLVPSFPLTEYPAAAIVSEERLRRYHGRYVGTSGDRFDIGVTNGCLTAAYSNDRGFRFTLYPQTERAFFALVVNGQAAFQTNGSGQSVAMTWTQGGPPLTYTKQSVPPRLLLSKAGPNAEIRLVDGDTEKEYVIEASADLRNWSSVATNTIWSPSLTEDTTARGAAFFRAKTR